MGDDDDGSDQEYGMEGEDEEYGAEEDESIFKSSKKSSKKQGKKQQKSIFADYDEFAHLLESDLYDGTLKKQKGSGSAPSFGGKRSKRGGPKGSGHQQGKRPRRK